MAVNESPLTRASLLLQIREPSNNGAWREFMSLYGPMVYGFARKRGLQDADASDLMQDVFRSVAAAIGQLEYDRKRGSFSGWLFTITRNKVFDFLSSRRGKAVAAGDTTTLEKLNSHADSSDGSEIWELDYQRRLAALAMERIKDEFQEKTWLAFRMTAVDGIGAAEVSKQLNLSPGAVYVAKSRVLARLKEEVDTVRRQEET